MAAYAITSSRRNLSPEGRGRLRQLRMRQLRIASVFILPYLVLFAIFGLYPAALAVWMSFFNWPPLGDVQFIGIDNFRELLRDEVVGKSIVNIAYFLVMDITGILLLSTLIALAMSVQLPFKGLVRVMYFSPAVTSMLVVSIIWSWIFSPNGALNYLIAMVGIREQKWLLDPDLVMPSLALMNIWRGAGFYAVIILAGLQSISRELYEAAAIDGSSGWQSFWKITIPLLMPTIELVIVLMTIWGFLLFTEPYVMTRGGPLDRSMTLAYHLYRQSFQFWRMGYGAAIGIVLLVMAFAIALIERRVIGQRVDF